MMPVLRIFYCVKFYLHFEDNLRPPFHQMSDFTSNPPPPLILAAIMYCPPQVFQPRSPDNYCTVPNAVAQPLGD